MQDIDTYDRSKRPLYKILSEPEKEHLVELYQEGCPMEVLKDYGVAIKNIRRWS